MKAETMAAISALKPQDLVVALKIAVKHESAGWRRKKSNSALLECQARLPLLIGRLRALAGI